MKSSTYTLAGRHICRVGYGAMALERYAGDRAAGEALVRQAVELGVDHIDTADFYGDSVANKIIRVALRETEDVVVVTKVGAVRTAEGDLPLRLAQKPHELREAVEDNLRTLGCERLDVVNLRRADTGPGIIATGDQLVDLDDQLAEMTAMRDQGLIGAIGISAVTDEVLRRALPAGIVCVQNAYGLLARGFEGMLELCVAEDVAWVPYFPLGSGFPGMPKVAEQPEVIEAAQRLGVTPAQVGLAWLLGHSPNALLIPGTASLKHLKQNVAVAAIDLDAGTTAELDGIWDDRFAGVEQQPRWVD